MSTFWSNAIRWLDQGRNGVVGVVEKRAVPVLSKSGFTCEYTDFRKDLSVYMGMAYSGAHAKEIQDFVAEGGGLVIGGHHRSLPLTWYEDKSDPTSSNCQQGMEGTRLLN
uniref:Uncharacterized protein n=1 Tax=Takifugu rubripes TaxID=31033 RepID=A0A3B5K0I7_TAKRU